MKTMSLAVLYLTLSAAAGPSWSMGVAGKAGAPKAYGRVFPPIISHESARAISMRFRAVDLSSIHPHEAAKIERLAVMDPTLPQTQLVFSALTLYRGDAVEAVSYVDAFLREVANAEAPRPENVDKPEAWERYAATLEEIDEVDGIINGKYPDSPFSIKRAEALAKAKLLRALRQEKLIKEAEAAAAALGGGAASKETQAPQEEPGALEAYYAALLDPSVDPKSASAVIEAIADHNRRAGKTERAAILGNLKGMQWEARKAGWPTRSKKMVLAALTLLAHKTPSNTQKLKAIDGILGAEFSQNLDGDHSMTQERLDAIRGILGRSNDKRLHAAGIRLLKSWRPELGKGRKAYNDAIDQIARLSQGLPGGPRKGVRKVNRFADFFAGAAARAKEGVKDHSGALVVSLLAFTAFLTGGLLASAPLVTAIGVAIAACFVLWGVLSILARMLGFGRL